MTPYGKVAHAALCATSLIAEYYDAKNPVRFSSQQIAERRKLSQAIVAKVLTTLSQTGVVVGTPGPGGGYTLSRAPDQITLLDIVAPFERFELSVSCPHGEGGCDLGENCPLYKQLDKFRMDVTEFLKNTTLQGFQRSLTEG